MDRADMTHPISPREKVARAIQAHDNDHVPDGYANGLSDEVSDWSAYLADRVLTALASGSGDHAELARLAEAAKAAGDPFYSFEGIAEWGEFQAAANPATVIALLAENAALRAQWAGADALASKHFVALREKQDDAQMLYHRATEAERKLAEARTVIERLASSEAFDMPRAIDGPLAAEVRARMDYARTFLSSKEAERG